MALPASIDEGIDHLPAKGDAVVCVVYLKVIGLSGILLDSQKTKETVSRNKDNLIPPRQMKASLAVVRDNQVYGISPDSKHLRRLLPTVAPLDDETQQQSTRRYIAVWDNNTIETTATPSGHVTATTADSTILFETTLSTKSCFDVTATTEIETSIPAQQNLKLIVGIKSVSDQSVTIPIGIASLPINDAATLRGSSGKVVLDLPIFNIPQDSSVAETNPFPSNLINVEPPKIDVKSKRNLFSRLKRAKDTTDMKSAVETQNSKSPCIYCLDSSAVDRATLRVELDIQEKESNVEIGLSSRSGSFLCIDEISNVCSPNSATQKSEVFLLEELHDGCSIQGIETSIHSKVYNNEMQLETSDLSQKYVDSNSAEDGQSIERVLSTRNPEQFTTKQSFLKFSPPRRFRVNCVDTDKSKFKMMRVCSESNDREFVPTTLENDAAEHEDLNIHDAILLGIENDLKTKRLDDEIERVLSLQQQYIDNSQGLLNADEGDISVVHNNIPLDEQSFLSRDAPAVIRRNDRNTAHKTNPVKLELPTKNPKFRAIWSRHKRTNSINETPTTSSVNGTESSSQTANTLEMDFMLPQRRSTIKKVLLPDVSNMLQSSIIDVPPNDYDPIIPEPKDPIDDANWKGVQTKIIPNSTELPHPKNDNVLRTTLDAPHTESNSELDTSLQIVGIEIPSEQQHQKERQISLEEFKPQPKRSVIVKKPISILRKPMTSARDISFKATTTSFDTSGLDKVDCKFDTVSVVSRSAETEVFKTTSPKPQVDYEQHFNQILKELALSKKVDSDGPDTDTTESIQSSSTNTTPPTPTTPKTTYSSPIPGFVEEESQPIIWKEKFRFEDESLINRDEPGVDCTNLDPLSELPLPTKNENVLAQKLYKFIDMQPCAGRMDQILEPNNGDDEDFTITDSWAHENSTIGTYPSRKVTMKDDLADLSLLWGDMCNQVKFRPHDDDDSTVERSKVEPKRRWTSPLNSDSKIRSFWTRKASELDEIDDECHSSEFSSGSFTDEQTYISTTAESESEFSEEGTEVNVNDISMASSDFLMPQKTKGSPKNTRLFTPAVRMSLVKPVNRSVNKFTSEPVSENKTVDDKSTVESKTTDNLIANTISPLDLENTKAMVTRACLSLPPLSPQTYKTVANDRTSKGIGENVREVVETDYVNQSFDENNNFDSVPPKNNNVAKSITQSLVDLVEYVISPSPTPPAIPTVVLNISHDDEVSVGELTATTYEQQVDVDEMLRQTGQRLLAIGNVSSSEFIDTNKVNNSGINNVNIEKDNISTTIAMLGGESTYGNSSNNHMNPTTIFSEYNDEGNSPTKSLHNDSTTEDIRRTLLQHDHHHQQQQYYDDVTEVAMEAAAVKRMAKTEIKK